MRERRDKKKRGERERRGEEKERAKEKREILQRLTFPPINAGVNRKSLGDIRIKTLIFKP